MSEFVGHISSLFLRFNGVFSKRSEWVVPEDIEEVYNRVYTEESIEPSYLDKINLSQDAQMLRGDFKKSIEAYKEGK